MPKNASRARHARGTATNDTAASRKQPPIQLEAIRCSRDNASRPNRLKRNSQIEQRAGDPGQHQEREAQTSTGMRNGASAGLALGNAGQDLAAEDESRG